MLSQFKIKEKKVFDVVYDYIITSKFEEIRNKEVNEITTFKEIFVFFTKFIKFCDDEQVVQIVKYCENVMQVLSC